MISNRYLNFLFFPYVCYYTAKPIRDYAMAMQFSSLTNHLMSFKIQVTKCRNSIPVLQYHLLCGGV